MYYLTLKMEKCLTVWYLLLHGQAGGINLQQVVYLIIEWQKSKLQGQGYGG